MNFKTINPSAWRWDVIILTALAICSIGALGYQDKMFDLQSAEQRKQDDCHRIMNSLGEVPAPLTDYCAGVKP